MAVGAITNIDVNNRTTNIDPETNLRILFLQYAAAVGLHETLTGRHVDLERALAG